MTTPCLERDPELWFSPEPADIKAAQSACGGCPQRFECLQGALDRREVWGVWGGAILRNGHITKRKPSRHVPLGAAS
jgi:WhiB family redox-sensing transcriptional regulator